MGWFEILLILLFIVFPLIEHIAASKRKKDQQPDELPPEYAGGGYEWEPMPGPQPHRRDGPAEAQGPSWSDDWGGWSEPEREEAPVAVAPSPRKEPEHGFHWEHLSRDTGARPLPEPVVPRPLPEPAVPAPTPVRVVSLDKLVVDREAEHRRFRDKVQQTSAPPTRRRPRNPLAEALRRPEDVRRAVLLSEVLGPPRALQSQDTQMP
jgi:hypothetical protein